MKYEVYSGKNGLNAKFIEIETGRIVFRPYKNMFLNDILKALPSDTELHWADCCNIKNLLNVEIGPYVGLDWRKISSFSERVMLEQTIVPSIVREKRSQLFSPPIHNFSMQNHYQKFNIFNSPPQNSVQENIIRNRLI